MRMVMIIMEHIVGALASLLHLLFELPYSQYFCPAVHSYI